MSIHSHKFVETYEGLVGFGADRETDENTVVYYLQKFSDDRLMKTIIKRLSDEELSLSVCLMKSSPKFLV
jgi:hypothetical protein